MEVLNYVVDSQDEKWCSKYLQENMNAARKLLAAKCVPHEGVRGIWKKARVECSIVIKDDLLPSEILIIITIIIIDDDNHGSNLKGGGAGAVLSGQVWRRASSLQYTTIS